MEASSPHLNFKRTAKKNYHVIDGKRTGCIEWPNRVQICTHSLEAEIAFDLIAADLFYS